MDNHNKSNVTPEDWGASFIEYLEGHHGLGPLGVIDTLATSMPRERAIQSYLMLSMPPVYDEELRVGE